MQRHKNLRVIGTSHIAIESVQEVQKVIKELKPRVVALELDQTRLHALLSGKKKRPSIADVRKVGVKGFLFNLLGAWIEKKLGKIVSTPPGSEMRAAVAAAREEGATIALIDQDIHITLKKLSKSITLKEKVRFARDLLIGARGKWGEERIDLRRVPDEKVIKGVTERVKKEYPSVYRVLIKERDEVMAKNLYKLMRMYEGKVIVAVVGAGHEAEIVEIIKRME